LRLPTRRSRRSRPKHIADPARTGHDYLTSGQDQPSCCKKADYSTIRHRLAEEIVHKESPLFYTIF